MNRDLRKTLKARAHHLHPVILMGAKGLTAAVIAETDLALTTHELIKVKLVGIDRVENLETAQALCLGTQAAFVQLIGHIAVLYRKNLL